jgi:beta-glucosidase/6-phospho-beta-glucosidase/beta-galactosidase
MFGHLGAFDGTKIHGWGVDILGSTNHIERWRHDLDMLSEAGIRNLRYSVPWHRIENAPGRFDFSWIDGPMEHMRATGMNPIVDPLHHTSFPDWLDEGLANPELSALYCRFLDRFSERYRWVRDYTIVNEPLPTTLFCSYTGMWYPHGTSDGEFVRMAVNVARTVCDAARLLRSRRSDVRLVHIDTCESHAALDREAEPWVAFANERRFLMHELILGRVGRGHPLSTYLARNGMTEDDVRRFQDRAAPFDILGLDSYSHSEMEWFTGEGGTAQISWPVTRPRGFASVSRDYQDRFGAPMLLAETNIRGTVEDRLTWLRFMQEQYDTAVAGGVDLRGFCWYPSIDTTDWANCCTHSTSEIDPQGLWILDTNRWERISSELSQCYSALARGKISYRDIPAYGFEEPLDRDLQGYLRLMKHWDDGLSPHLDEAA